MSFVFFHVVSWLWESRMKDKEAYQAWLREQNERPVLKFEDVEYLAWYACCITWKRFLHYSRWFPDPGWWHHIILCCIPVFWLFFNLEDLHETLRDAVRDSEPSKYTNITNTRWLLPRASIVELHESTLESITRLLVKLIEFYMFSCWQYVKESKCFAAAQCGVRKWQGPDICWEHVRDLRMVLFICISIVLLIEIGFDWIENIDDWMCETRNILKD